MFGKSRVIAVVAVLLLLGITCGIAAAAEVAPGVVIKGYMQNRFYAAPGANGEFRSERISISAVAALPNDSTGYVELYYHPWGSGSGLYLESAYYDTALGKGRIRIGKGRRMTFGITPAWPSRKTSNYGVVSEAFTQDRIQGVQYMLQQGVLDLGVSAHTAYRLGTRNLGEIPGDTVRNPAHQVSHLALRDLPGELSRHLEISARLGGKWPNGLKAGVSYSAGTLDGRDLATLKTAGLVSAASTDDDRNVLGLDVSYKAPSGFILQGEWYDSGAGDLDYGAWNLLAGTELPSGWKVFARYGVQDMDVTATSNQLTWDTQQISLSVVQPLRKNLWIQYEYEINDEDPPAGVGSVKNDLFFVELFTGF